MKNSKIYTLLALCVLFWSGNFVLGRYVSSNMSPIELAFFRWLFAIIVTLPFIFKVDMKKVIRIFKKNFILISFLALFGITLYNTLLYVALQTTTATNALLINSIIPVLILVFSFFILNTRITKIQTAGIVLSTFGVIFLVLKGDLANISNMQFTQGDLWVFLSAIIWATYSTIVKLKPKGLTHLEFFITILYVGFIFLLIPYLMQGYTLHRELKILENNWYFFVYVSLFASLLSFYFWHLGIDNIGAEKTGQFTHLMPLFGSTLAFIFLGERLEVFHIIGAVFIALGIYLSLFFVRKKAIE